LILGNINFGDKFVSLSGHYNSLTEAQNAGAPVIAYGMFVNAVIEFIIIALVMFLLIREINRLRRKPEAQKEPTEKNCPFCFTVIPIRAVRCPNCTSELEPESTESACRPRRKKV
jgi:large conductance mechanosensitive channel